MHRIFLTPTNRAVVHAGHGGVHCAGGARGERGDERGRHVGGRGDAAQGGVWLGPARGRGGVPLPSA
eukprot:5546755-Pyramimonas_sp.AAC.1